MNGQTNGFIKFYLFLLRPCLLKIMRITFQLQEITDFGLGIIFERMLVWYFTINNVKKHFLYFIGGQKSNPFHCLGMKIRHKVILMNFILFGMFIKYYV